MSYIQNMCKKLEHTTKRNKYVDTLYIFLPPKIYIHNISTCRLSVLKAPKRPIKYHDRNTCNQWKTNDKEVMCYIMCTDDYYYYL